MRRRGKGDKMTNGSGDADGVGRRDKQIRQLRWPVLGIAIGIPVFGGGSTWGFIRDERNDNRVQALVEAEAREDEVEAATMCVTAWDVRQQIRDSDEAHGVAAGEALIEAVNPSDPDLVARYREILARRLADSSATIDDPACDLEAAQATLEEEARRAAEEEEETP